MSILDKLNKKKANNKSNIESDPTPDTELAYKEIHKFLATTSILIKKEMTTYVDGLIKAKFKKKSDINRFEKNFNKLNNANIIFMDAPKDDNFEYKMMRLFLKLDKKKGKLLILDDIKFVNMIDLWRSVKSPKIDLSSFGHWTGTGVIDISEGLKF